MQFQRILFYLSAAGLCFIYGVAVGVFEIFPYKQLKYVLNSVETVVANRDNLLSNRPTGFLAERRYDGDGVTVHDEARTAPGLTLLSGFFGDMPGMRLVALDGSVVAEWPVSYTSLFPDSGHISPQAEVPAGDWNAAIHGMDILPDGSIVFNFDGKGMVKLDRCGKVQWTVKRMTHHSIDRAADGGFWVPSRHWIEEQPGYPRFAVPYWDDTILQVSADGEVLSERSVNQVLVDSGLYALLVANGRFPSNVTEEDVLHLNDIDELTADRATAFPAFATGDLLLSLRHLNLVMVVDAGTWRVKWHQSGPWLRQHDPDFQRNGTITVFNNNSDDTKRGEIHGGSNIMSIQPFSATRQVDTIYGDRQDQAFFTNTQGKHQRLENGNLLIAEYYGGRVIEVTPSGETVWEYINKYDDESVAKVSGVMRYPQSYFDVQDWSCPAD